MTSANAEQGKPTMSDPFEPEQLVNMYQGSATIHGVPKILAPQFYSFRRYLWGLLVIGMTIGLVIFLYKSFISYYQYPIVTNTRLEFNNHMQFPAVTICNANQFHTQRIPNDTEIKDLIFQMSEMSVLKEIFKDHFRQQNVDYAFVPEMDKHSGENMYKFAMDAAHRLNDMFIVCIWGSKRVNCSDYFESVITDMGVCYTFNGNRSSVKTSFGSGSQSGLRVILDIEQPYYYFSKITLAGVKVLFHEPGSVPLLVSNGFVVQPGTSTSVTIRKHRIDGLPKPFKAFGSDYCLETDDEDFKNPLQRYQDYLYNRETCEMNCLVNYFVEQCNCRHFYDRGNESFCSLSTLMDCYNPFKVTTNISSVLQNCTCPSRCEKIKYITSTSVADFASKFIKDYMVQEKILKDSSYISENVIDLRIYYETLTVTVTEQKAEITIESILGDLGGQMGLFIGASVLSVVELIEFVALVVFGCYNTRRFHTHPIHATVGPQPSAKTEL